LKITISTGYVATGALQRTLPQPVQRVWGLAFHPDGVRLAIAIADQTVTLWDMQADQLLHVFEGHTSTVRAVAFHPTGQWLASGGDDRTIRLWKLADGQLHQTLLGHTHTVAALAFTPDGQGLISSGADQTMRSWVWAADSGQWQQRHLLVEQLFKFNSSALSPDGATLVSGSINTNVHLWDVQTGQKRHTLRGHTNLVTAVHVGPDGQQAVSSSGDGTLRLWEIATGACLGTLRTQGPYNGLKLTGATGISAAQRAALKLLGAVEA
jgi:WD40 repeat protein